MEQVWNLIHMVDATFAKDDMQSCPRKVLEELIVNMYDGLKSLAGSLES